VCVLPLAAFLNRGQRRCNEADTAFLQGFPGC